MHTRPHRFAARRAAIRLGFRGRRDSSVSTAERTLPGNSIVLYCHFLDQHARRTAPLAAGKCRAASLIAGLRGYSYVGLGIPFGGSPPPVNPPLRPARRGSWARFALATGAPTLRYGKRNAHPSRVRENTALHKLTGGAPCGFPLSGDRALNPHAAALGYSSGGICSATAQTRRRSRPPLRGARKRFYAVAPARRCSRTWQPRLRKSADAPTRNSRKAIFPPFRLADNIRAATGLLSRAVPLRGAVAPLTAPGLRVKSKQAKRRKYERL